MNIAKAVGKEALALSEIKDSKGKRKTKEKEKEKVKVKEKQKPVKRKRRLPPMVRQRLL